LAQCRARDRMFAGQNDADRCRLTRMMTRRGRGILVDDRFELGMSYARILAMLSLIVRMPSCVVIRALTRGC
jgi:hypothetical protein